MAGLVVALTVGLSTVCVAQDVAPATHPKPPGTTEPAAAAKPSAAPAVAPAVAPMPAAEPAAKAPAAEPPPAPVAPILPPEVNETIVRVVGTMEGAEKSLTAITSVDTDLGRLRDEIDGVISKSTRTADGLRPRLADIQSQIDLSLIHI